MAIPCPTKVWHSDTYPAISPEQPRLSKADKSVFITGASPGGIGSGIATSFARAGASAIGLFGRKPANLAKTKEAITAIAPEAAVHIYTGDLTDAASVQRAVSDFAAKSPSGTIDILVANAGYLADLDTIAGSDPADWWAGFETNILGNFHLVRAFFPHATPNKDGKSATIVHISSSAIHIPYLPGFSSYRGSKIGAHKVFEYVAQEHPDIHVVQVHPGLILTSELATKFSGELEDPKYANYVADTSKYRNPFGRKRSR